LSHTAPSTLPPSFYITNNSGIVTYAQANTQFSVSSFEPIIPDIIINLPTNIDRTLQVILFVTTRGNPIRGAAWSMLCNSVEETVLNLQSQSANISFIVGDRNVGSHLMFQSFINPNRASDSQISVSYTVKGKCTYIVLY